MKKRMLALLLVLVMVLSAMPMGLAAEAVDGDIYVAPAGSDANDGTADKPVATLARAAELARGKDGAVTVSVAAGKYFLEEALTLGPADSNVTWVADGEVVLTGAKDLGKLTWTEYQNGIYVADVEKGLAIDQLFINGDQQILARYPNYNAGQTLQGSTSAANIKAHSVNWADPAGGYIRALHSYKWGGNSYRITGKAENSLGLSYEWIGDNNRGSGMQTSFVMVENIFEELDSALEWYYDGDNGKLYVMPGEGVTLDGALVEGAVTEELIHIQGVQDGAQAENITFDGFTLENTARTMFTGTYVPLMRSDWCVVRSGALFMQDAEHITFQNGTIRNIGGNAVFMSGHNDGNVIHNNEICNIGSSGVLIAGLPDSCREPSFWDYSSPLDPETDTNYVHKTTIDDATPGPIAEHYPKNCTVSENHIKNVGIWEKQSSHVALSVAHKIDILRNTMNIGPRAGINVGDGTFGGHEIAYNDVFDVQLETDDHGMFNSWGRDRFWSLGGHDTGGNRGALKEPYSMIDCIDTIVIHDNRMHFGGRVDGGSTFGIDLDDGSSNYEIYNNLCLNMGIKLREGFHRRVYNNILVNGQFNLHCTFEDSYDEIYSNIVIKGSPYALAATSESRFAVSEDVIDKNWFYDLGMLVSFPSYWDALGYEANSIRGTSDPQFKDAANNDYTVLNEEAAASIGFVNFPMDQFGKPDCEDVCPLYAKTSPDSNVDVLERENWLGATISAVDFAIMSSTGAGSLNGVYVEEIPEGAALAKYGLQTGDVIHSINGVELVKKSEFLPIYHRQLSGDLVHLTIIRNQLPMELTFIKNESGMTMIDDQDSRIVYGGDGWDYSGPDRNLSNAVDCYNQTMTYKNVTNSKEGVFVELRFTGSRVVLYGRKENNMGNYRIVITNADGDQVVNTTASAYIASGRPDFTSIYDSADALTEGNYTIRVSPESGDYMIVDAFGIVSAAESTLSAHVGPASITNEAGALVSVLEDGQKLTIKMPITNTSAGILATNVTAMLYDGPGLRQATELQSAAATLAAGETRTVTLSVNIPTGSASMRLAILVRNAFNGQPLNYPYEVDGAQIVDGVEVVVPTPTSDTIAVTYDASTGLATAALAGLAPEKQASLKVGDRIWQTTVDANGVAAFVFVPPYTEAAAMTLAISAERASTIARTINFDPAVSILDKSGLAEAMENAALVLGEADKETYTVESWKALEDAYASAQSIYEDDRASQAQIQAAIDTLNDAVAGLKVANVEFYTYDPSAASKGTFFQIYDQNGNVDAGNKDGYNGVWQARASQVDTTQAGAWFEMTGKFASFTIIGADKNDSANFIVKITNEATGEVITENITATKVRNGDVIIYEKPNLPGTLQTIRVYNNENGCYLEIRGIECTVALDSSTEALEEAIAQAEALNRNDYFSVTELEAALAAAKSVLENANASQSDVDAAVEALRNALAALKQIITESGTYDPSASSKGTWFHIYDQNGNEDAGNKDGGSGVWQARPSQVDTTQAGAYFEVNGRFTGIRVTTANKNDSANYIVEIIDAATGETVTDSVTTSKNQNGDVVTYSNDALSGEMQTIRLYNNENSNYMELRSLEFTVAEPRDKTALKAAVAGAEALDGQIYLTMDAVNEALSAAKSELARNDVTQAELDAAEAALKAAVNGLKQVVKTGGVLDPSANDKGTWFRIYDQNGNPDPGNKDGKNGVWQARASQVDTTQAGAWFEMTGKFTAFRLIGADKYDSANFIVKIRNEITGQVSEETVTLSKNRSGDVVLYEINELSGDMVTIQVINNESGLYLEVRGIECALAQPNTLILSGAEEATIGDENVSYTIAVRDTVDLATATFILDVDDVLLTDAIAQPLNGWQILAQTNENGKMKIVAYNIDGLTTDQPVEILSITMKTGAKAGTANMTLSKAVLSGYTEEAEQFLTPAFKNTSVSTEVKYHIYDVNRDTVVNQLDVTRTQRWYGTDDAICDVDGSGNVDIADIVLILNYYYK